MPEILVRYSDKFITGKIHIPFTWIDKETSAYTAEIRTALSEVIRNYMSYPDDAIVADWQKFNMQNRFDIEVEIRATVNNDWLNNLTIVRVQCMIALAQVLLKHGHITYEQLLLGTPEVSFSVWPFLTQGGFDDHTTIEWQVFRNMLTPEPQT